MKAEQNQPPRRQARQDLQTPAGGVNWFIFILKYFLLGALGVLAVGFVLP